MNFSQKAKEHIDSCRFCWMCHHVCPIGNATGLERTTVRARALGLSMVARDSVPYSEDIINNVYECSLCGGCMTDCVTGWDPVMFTKEARLGAALDGKLPPYVAKMVSNLLEKGSIYGDAPKKAPAVSGGDTLFFLGEDARHHGDAETAVKLLNAAGVEFTVLENEPSSGYTLDFLIGASAETKDVMEKCAAEVSKFRRVVCYDPADARVMKREYKEWGIALDAEVFTFTEYLAGLMKDGSLKIKKSGKVFTPQDSPILARDLSESEPIREILSACGEVNEMLLNREHTMLAGNLIMNEYMPAVMEQVAKNRWINAANAGAGILVTASTAEYALLSKSKPEDIGLMKLEEVLMSCL